MFKFLRKTALWIVALPLLCWTLGLASNQAVLVANHDRFPVMWNDYKVSQYAQEINKVAEGDDPEAAKAKFDLVALVEHGYLDDTHIVMTEDTHLNFLADWIDLRNTYSPGDVLLIAGEFGMTYSPIIWCVVIIGRLRKKED